MGLLRPLRSSDIEAVVAVYRTVWGAARPIHAGDLVLWLRDPEVDPERLRVLEIDGDVVAYGDLTVADGVVALEVAAPGYWDVFLDWAEDAARDVGAHRVRTLNYRGTELPAVAAARGYVLWRSSFTMRLELGSDPPEASPTPVGLEIRPYTDQDADQLLSAVNDIFEADPFFVQMTRAQFQANYVAKPGMNHILWLLAWADEKIAGFALGFSESHGDDCVGELRSVGVRPGWRKRGLGEAVVRRTLRQLHEQGLRSVTLGVDASNETQAVRLYERVGMRVVARQDNWALDFT